MTNKHSSAEDDGRVIADMSGVQRKSLWLPRMDSEEETDARPWDQSGKWSRSERRSALWGALSASLLIGLAFLLGLGLLLLILTLYWR